MIKKSNREKLLALFFDRPTKQFQLREMSKLTCIGLPSVKKYIETFVKEGLVKKEMGTVFPYFIANRESIEFRVLKVSYLRIALEECGIVAKLEHAYPDCIVLFGSGSRGEDTEKSDIDIFIQGEETDVPTPALEKIIKRKMNLMFESDLKKLPNELKNNIANGIVLRGYFNAVCA